VGGASKVRAKFHLQENKLWDSEEVRQLENVTFFLPGDNVF